MQLLILRSEKTDEKLELSFGVLMSVSRLPKEEQAKFLQDQANKNFDTLYKHFQKEPKDKLSLVSIVNQD